MTTATPIARLIERLVRMRDRADRRRNDKVFFDGPLYHRLNGERDALNRALRVARKMAREER